MKCENCGNELTGGAIICRACNHNNARRAVSQWRARKTGELQEPPSRQIAPIPAEPKIISRKDTEANLLRFPASPRPFPAQRAVARPAEAAVETASIPAWREQVKEKVRLARQRRQPEAAAVALAPEPAAQPLDRNPIVESALNRIRRVQHPLAVPTRGSARPALLREMDDVEEESEPPRDPLIAPRAEERLQQPAPPPPAKQIEVVGLVENAPEIQLPPKRTTKPLPDRPARHETRTLTPKTQAARPELKPLTLGNSVILTPRSQPSAEAAATPASAQSPVGIAATGPVAEDRIQHPTEIIEMSQAVRELPLPVVKPATLWLRTLAGACDFEIIATAYLPLFGAYATLNTSVGWESFFVMAVLMAASVFVYQLVMLLVSGRTFGMAMMNLRLVNTDDEELPVTRRQKMLRAWAATLAFLLLPVNLLITRLNYPNRSLPDLISGTTIAGK